MELKSKESDCNKAETLKTNFEAVINELGVFKLYQIRIVISMFISGALAAMLIIGGTLMAASVSYTCSSILLSPMKQEFCGLNDTQANKTSFIDIIDTISKSSGISLDRECKMYNFESEISKDNCSILLTSINTYENNTTHLPALNKDNSTEQQFLNLSSEKCTDWKYNTEVFHSTVVTDLNLVCDQKSKKEVSQIVLMFGVLFGAFIFGIMTDRLGRRPSLCFASLTLALSSVCTSFVWNYWLYCITQFLTGIGGMGLFVVGFINCMELVGKKWRVPLGQLMQSSFSVGFMCLACLGYFIRDWRTLNLIISLSTIPTLLFFWAFSLESPRWLMSKYKMERAKEIVEKIAKINNITLDLTNVNLLYNNEITNKAGNVFDVESQNKLTLSDLFTNKTLRKITAILCANWFSVTCVYYGLTFNSTSLAGNPFLNLFLSGLVEIPANFLGVFIIRIWGRRPTIFISNIMSGVALLCMYFLSSVQGSYYASMTLYLIGKFGATSTFSCIYIYTTELYPTPLRGHGLGCCSSAARIGGLCSVAVIMLKYYANYLPFVFYGLVALTSGILIPILPETKGNKLPDTLQDCENLYIIRHITLPEQFKCKC